MKPLLLAVSVLVLLALCALSWANWPARVAPLNAPVHHVIVKKSARVLELVIDGRVVRSYRISLGWMPSGHKLKEGDGRTPEGEYLLDWRNPRSSYYRSMHVSYPNEADRQKAAQSGVNPGGDIMVHGIRNGLGWLGRLHVLVDWTAGCVAVTDREMDEIWQWVPDGTPITLLP